MAIKELGAHMLSAHYTIFNLHTIHSTHTEKTTIKYLGHTWHMLSAHTTQYLIYTRCIIHTKYTHTTNYNQIAGAQMAHAFDTLYTAHCRGYTLCKMDTTYCTLYDHIFTRLNVNIAHTHCTMISVNFTLHNIQQ